MNRRGFFAAGIVGAFFPWRNRRCKPTSTPTTKLPVIRFATRDKVANAKELFAGQDFHPCPRPIYPSTTMRLAKAYLPRDRAFLFYRGKVPIDPMYSFLYGEPAIWYGNCTVVQYSYSVHGKNMFSQVIIFQNKESTIEDFPKDKEN